MHMNSSNILMYYPTEEGAIKKSREASLAAQTGWCGQQTR
jgi:hypothetical protein